MTFSTPPDQMNTTSVFDRSFHRPSAEVLSTFDLDNRSHLHLTRERKFKDHRESLRGYLNAWDDEDAEAEEED